MRRLSVTAAVLGFCVTPALADHEPVIVIPGRPGVPVIINGRDASYSVVEGDWGLARSIHVQPSVTWNWQYWQPYGWQAPVRPLPGHYYPSAGQRPGYGRLEIQPPRNRTPPPQAETFRRDWGAQSQPQGPVTEYPPFDPPPVIYGPIGPRRPVPHNPQHP